MNLRNAYLVSLQLLLTVGGVTLTGAVRHTSAAQTIGLQEVHRIQLDGFVNAVTWNADGTRLAALSNFGGTIEAWNAKEWRHQIEFHRIGGAYSRNSFAYLPDGALLTGAPVNVSREGNALSLIKWDAATGKLLKEVPGPSSPVSQRVNIVDTFSVSKDGARVAAIPTHYLQQVILFDSKDWTITRILNIPPTSTHPDFALSLAITPNGRDVAVGTGSGYVRFFSIKTGALRRSIFAFPDGSACNAIAISPDGRLIAVGRWAGNSADSNTLTIWRVSDGAHIRSFPGTAQVIRSLAWDSANGLLAVGDDTSLRVFRVRDTDQELLFSKSFSRGVFSVAFSPTGFLAVAAGTEIAIFR